MKRVIHVSEVAITEETGMGRIAFHWRRAFQSRGYEFVHVSPSDVGRLPHKALFGSAAFRRCESLLKDAAVCLVHEPASAPFARGFPATVVFSHGMERRGWDIALANQSPDEQIKLKSRVLFPLWRIRPSESGLRGALGLLVSNEEDKLYAVQRYGRRREDVVVFRNGVHPPGPIPERGAPAAILFMGTWIRRKGCHNLVNAAAQLFERGFRTQWVLAGTGFSEEAVLRDWPPGLRQFVKVIPAFKREQESTILRGANIFVLPSLFEGQPLALLQAMAAGCCCVVTDCCGQKDLIAHGKTGLLFAPGDANGLAEALGRVLGDEKVRLELGLAARDAVCGRTWEAVSDEVVSLVEAFSSRGPSVSDPHGRT